MTTLPNVDALAAKPASPRVSCIVPTGDRRGVLPLLLEGIASQTFSEVEVVVVDGGKVSSEDLLTGHPLVRYARVSPDATLGARRNLACELATGEVIVHWDDDDWYSPERLARQVEPILRGEADVTGLRCRHVLALAEGRWWTMTDWLHGRLFVGNVHGGTLAFRRTLLGRRLRYPDVNRAEEQRLLSQMLRQGARLLAVEGEDLFAYVRHGRNAWDCEPGKLLRASAWRPGAAPKGMEREMVDRYVQALPTTAARSPAPARPAVMRRASPGSTFVDCLGAAEVRLARPFSPRDRCIAVAASEGAGPLLDVLLSSLRQRGNRGDVQVSVFAAGSESFVDAVRRKHGVEVCRVRPLRAAGPALKGLLYSLPELIEARQYLLLDADMVVLDEIPPLFDRLDAELPGTTLVAREGPVGRPLQLGPGLSIVHQATPADVEWLCPNAALRETVPCVNDGVVVASREALRVLERTIRERPDWVAWSQARKDVAWRQKGVFNLALAVAGAVGCLDPRDNFQLDADAVEEERSDGTLKARWAGKAVRVLHFNGRGRSQWPLWQREVLAGRLAPKRSRVPAPMAPPGPRPARADALAPAPDRIVAEARRAHLGSLRKAVAHDSEGSRHLDRLQELSATADRDGVTLSRDEGKILALTSLSPDPRQRASQAGAIASWRAAGLRPISFNHPSELPALAGYEGVEFVPVEETARPHFGRHLIPIRRMLDHVVRAEGHILLINADIVLGCSAWELKRAAWLSDEGLCYFMRQNHATDMAQAVPERYGIDAFLFHARHIHVAAETFLCMGKPFWDYWIPHAFQSRGLPLYTLGGQVAFHRNHPTRWSEEDLHRCALEFARFSGSLGEDRSFRACIDMGLKLRASFEQETCVLPPVPVRMRRWVETALAGEGRERTILELGAHCGEDTAWLSSIPHATVHAFEPDPRNTPSRVPPNVVFNRSAIWDRVGRGVLVQSREGWGREWTESSSLKRPHQHLRWYPVTFGGGIEVDTVTLDHYARDRGLGDVDFIWADVQGAEAEMVRGGRELLARTRYLYTEYSDEELYEGQITLRGLLALLPGWRVLDLYPQDVLLQNGRWPP